MSDKVSQLHIEVEEFLRDFSHSIFYIYRHKEINSTEDLNTYYANKAEQLLKIIEDITKVKHYE